MEGVLSPRKDPDHASYEVLEVRPSADEEKRQRYPAPPNKVKKNHR